jgi:hypothetical protein
MPSVFGRLTYNFDDTKYGDAFYLTTETKNYLNTSPLEIKTWQKTDIANGNIQNTNYFKNPVINVTNTFIQTVNAFTGRFPKEIVCDSEPTINGQFIYTTVQTLEIELGKYRTHTSNVSGVNDSTQTVTGDGASIIDYPDYKKSVGLGQQLLQLVNVTDGVQNASPLLGSMTSLFIGDELASNLTIIASDMLTLNATMRAVLVSDGGAPPVYTTVYYSNITSSNANTILSHVATANTMLRVRREHDWDFYRNGVSIVNDYFKVDSLGRLGNTQNYLVNNLIGTDRYISNTLANT